MWSKVALAGFMTLAAVGECVYIQTHPIPEGVVEVSIFHLTGSALDDPDISFTTIDGKTPVAAQMVGENRWKIAYGSYRAKISSRSFYPEYRDVHIQQSEVSLRADLTVMPLENCGPSGGGAIRGRVRLPA